MQVNTMIFIWLGLLVLFLAVEFATAQLTTVWFALGAMVALLLAAFGVEESKLRAMAEKALRGKQIVHGLTDLTLEDVENIFKMCM